MAAGDGSGEAILQALVQDICLRRKKDMKFVDLKLPEKKEYLHRITFHPSEKQKYDALLYVTRTRLPKRKLQSGTNDAAVPRLAGRCRNSRTSRLGKRAASRMSWSGCFDFGKRRCAKWLSRSLF